MCDMSVYICVCKHVSHMRTDMAHVICVHVYFKFYYRHLFVCMCG